MTNDRLPGLSCLVVPLWLYPAVHELCLALRFGASSRKGTVMNRLFDRVVSLCGLYVLLAAFCVAQFVHAQDELPCPPPAGGKVQFGDHPIFSKLPLAADYLHRVVANDKGEVIIYLKKMPQA